MKIIFLFFLGCCLASVWTPFQKKSSCKANFCTENDWSFEGEIVGFADYDDDRQIEIIVLSSDKKSIKLMKENNSGKTIKYEEFKTLLTFNETIINVIAGDFLFNGETSLVVQTFKNNIYPTYLCYHVNDKLVCAQPISLYGEATAFDVNGDNYIDLISLNSKKTTSVWLNKGDKSFKESHEYIFPTYDATFPITMADINGDCRSDLLFVVNNKGNHEIQIYTSQTTKDSGDYKVLNYSLSRTVKINGTIDNILVNDFDRDGNIDLLWSMKNIIHIQYNKQKTVCKSFVKSDSSCRSQNEMCVADEDYQFEDGNSIEYILPNGIELVIENGLSFISMGDYNIDSYPDLLVLVQNTTKTHYMMLLKNDNGKTITEEESEKETIKQTSLGAMSGVFFDGDNKGMLDLFFNIKDESNGTSIRKVKAISNNLKPDALFVKIVGLNGVCVSSCGSGYQTISPKPYGSNYFGGMFKLALTNTDGNNVGLASVQISQTTHGSIQFPYSHIGLGRISNYIQVVEFGSNMNVSVIHQQFQSIIPNSQLVVIPHPPLKSSKWSIELYFLDLNLMFWIAISMTIALIILGIIMLVLFIRDKKKEAESHFLNMK
ncbi:hypothetical protein, conserved [Entamoeba histolytica HM-1:IMSS]|uniref:T-cell immunomodulatory protein TIP C2 domain-containing protein n=1 Tax=Entamoeba histolytica (strain ATCC 30459 / HM-1:IMSS / ABRM) TaxID=294381 RepID=C4LZ19_ENTH1|nr:hypothetical protein, conserved [Entamoeba histolytica HM-1:IMSS]EAL45995.1 hypothetical protein, conserved [Entamoeba histolytica HM-1:IMSS]|eukprot:XP_651381.1 hypothetical protein, conserved [Entamoeba histolytica HM-1:IMSS]